MKSYLKVVGIKRFVNPSRKFGMYGGIDLSKYKTVKRNSEHFNTGISTDSYGDCWFETPNGKALFKTFDNYYLILSRDMRIINELVCMELLNELNIPCAQYEPAYLSFEEDDEDYSDGRKIKINYDGLITYNIANDNEKVIPFYELLGEHSKNECTLANVSRLLDEIKSQGYKFSKKDIILSLYSNSVFDFIVKQTDRNYNNVNFIVDEDNNVRFADIIDNEFAFVGHYFSRSHINEEEREYYELLAYYNDYADIIPIKKPDYSNRLNSIVTDLVQCAKAYPEMMQILTHIIENLDIEKALVSVEKRGIHITEEYKTFMKGVVDDSISNLKSKLADKRYDIEQIERLY